MKRIISTFFILSMIFSTLNAQKWQTDYEKAREEAENTNRRILLVFEGSDWCAPCIKLNREILNNEEFISYAKDHFVLLKADFPRKKKNRLDKSQQKKNNELADIYNPQGYFPFVVVLDKDGSVLGETGYKNISPIDYFNLLNSFTAFLKPLQTYKQTVKLMGCRFEITVVAADSGTADHYIDMAVTEITRIEKLISSWDPDSQTSKINRNAGLQPVKVDKELYDLISRTIEISKLTDGAFDITYAAMDDIWKFDGSMTTLPSPEKINSARAKVGYQNIILNSKEQSIFLKLKGMKIGFGAVGKGYAADKAKDLLISEGVKSGIINASGDLTTWGMQPDGEDWKVAITNPYNKNSAFALLPTRKGAVITSGNYEKFIMINGKRYTHIINPKTGYPSSGISSVTVFAPKAELADALATSIFVMGKTVGIDRINQLPEVECLIIDENGNISTSTNLIIEQL